jgi:hypothetical protein
MDAKFLGIKLSKLHFELHRDDNREEEHNYKVKALPDRNSYLSLPSLFSNASTADSYIPTNKFPKVY